MADKTINIVVNPAHSKTNWFTDFYKGALSRAALKNAKLNVMMYEDNLCEICEICRRTSGCVILVSSSSAWENEVINYLSAREVHSIITRPSVYDASLSCSSVSPDYFNAAFSIMKYFIESGRKKIAYFAYNADSSQDIQKFRAYEYAVSLSDLSFSKEDVFINFGNLEDCADELYKKAENYDALLCANDAAAIVLINRLKSSEKKDLLDRIDIASFGNTKLLKMLFPKVISASLNFEKAGECAADLYLNLCGNSSVVACEYRVSSDINIPSPRKRVLTLDTTRKESTPEKGVSFYSDRSVVEVFEAENALSRCDELDIKIIDLLMKKFSYEKIAEHTNTAVTTVKYRLKKIFSLFGVSSKGELYKALGKYFNNQTKDV